MRNLAIAIVVALIVTGEVWRATAEEAVQPRTIRGVTYVQRGAEELKADIYVPPGEGPYPGVLMVHGGAWMSGNKSHVTRHARVVAQNGYTVVAINYRLAPKHKFPAQFEDCQTAVRWMRDNAAKYLIDPLRVAGYGYSAGGHLVCLLGASSSAPGANAPRQEDDHAAMRLQAVVAGGAPCDFRQLPAENEALAYWLGGTRGQFPETYRLASPASFVSADDPPVFFFHGEQDRLVPRQSPARMMERLRHAGVPAEMLVVAGKGHIGAFMDGQPPLQAVRFLNRVLKQIPDRPADPAPGSSGPKSGPRASAANDDPSP